MKYKLLFLALFFFLPLTSFASVIEWDNTATSFEIYLDPDNDDTFLKLVTETGTGYQGTREYLGSTANYTFGTDPAILSTASLNNIIRDYGTDGKNLLIIYDGINAGNYSAANANGNGGSGNLEDYNGYTDFLALFYIEFDDATNEIVCMGYNSDDSCNTTLKTVEETSEPFSNPLIITDYRLSSSTCINNASGTDCEYFYDISTSTQQFSAQATPLNIFLYFLYFGIVVFTFAILTRRTL